MHRKETTKASSALKVEGDEISLITTAQRALEITELLENVLQCLSIWDLLFNKQAVSHFWKNCIQGSP
jgi:hypothetical protein